MKQKELTKAFMMISNRKPPFGLRGLYQNFSEHCIRVNRVTYYQIIGLIICENDDSTLKVGISTHVYVGMC